MKDSEQFRDKGLEEFLDRYKNRESKTRFKKRMALGIFFDLPDEDRLEIFSYFCLGCGTDKLPCYCMRDD